MFDISETWRVIMNEILRVESLTKRFTKKGFFRSQLQALTAVDNVSF